VGIRVHSKLIGCSASKAYAPGSGDEQEEVIRHEPLYLSFVNIIEIPKMYTVF